MEPWLRGPIPDVSPLVAPVLYSFEQAREDLAEHTEGLTTEQVWARPLDLAPLPDHPARVLFTSEVIDST